MKLFDYMLDGGGGICESLTGGGSQMEDMASRWGGIKSSRCHDIVLKTICPSDHLRDAPREDLFKVTASAAAREFCKGVQDGIDVYIPL